MHLSKRTWVALILLLPVAAFLTYQLGVYLYGRHHYRAAEEALDRRDFADASAHLERCLSVAPGDLPTRLLAAQAARRRHEWDEARLNVREFKQSGGPPEAEELDYHLMQAQQGDTNEA